MIDLSDERTYHNPLWFEKIVTVDSSGFKKYTYVPKANAYWEAREKGDWSTAPRIYDDDC